MGLIDMQELTGNSSMNDRTESLGASGKVSKLKTVTKKAGEKLGAKKALAKAESAKSASQEKPEDKTSEEPTKPSKKKVVIIAGVVIVLGIVGFVLYKKFKK
ncbi:MAG: hypothetical protein PHX80_04745 [Candidatus Nanoarchaeia archaeon]|nr:hypothetical protein [Candidatus Nanoarchaeia archaeon]